MRPLTRGCRLKRAGLPNTGTPNIEDEIVSASGGHPLALKLILDRLMDSVDDKSVEETLARWMDHAGDVREDYHSYWRSIETDRDLSRLLALLARFRRPIDLGWIQEWTDRGVMKRLDRNARHYLQREGDRWFFTIVVASLFCERRRGDRTELLVLQSSAAGSPADQAFSRLVISASKK
jgi:hypothetical protein